MNYLWGGMMIVGVIYGALTGRLDAVTDQALASAKEAVTLCITMAGVMAFWVGIMRIAERAGMVEQASRRLGPVMDFLFPGVPKDSPARTYIAVNMVANVLGLGWAATPAGLKAMEELAKLEEERGNSAYLPTAGIEKNSGAEAAGGRGNGGLSVGMRKVAVDGSSKGKMAGVPGVGDEKRGKRERAASNEMCTFLILNISSLQLIPVNMIAYRQQYGSVNPAGIIAPAIVATAVSTGVAVVYCKGKDWKRRV